MIHSRTILESVSASVRASHGRKIAVVGLGYVGLPVAVAFGAQAQTIGFDIKQSRIDSLLKNIDITFSISAENLQKTKLLLTSDPVQLAEADFYIIAVPTPVDIAKTPNLEPLLSASKVVGRHLKVGDIVVYESTVYPGTTEEICLPVLEQASGLRGGVDFFVGYSPERINPGDKEHDLTSIVKIVSGQTPAVLEIIAKVYGSIISAGVYKAGSIKVAEAAKVIENTQRDLNIALMNELAIIFERMNIDTREVLAASKTKWNFVSFEPGLVGGHCIGVDPYYLTYKAQQLGCRPEVILAGRHINDEMGKFIAKKTIKILIEEGAPIKGARIAVLGLTFKENSPDLRNSLVIDLIRELKDYGVEVLVHDPIACPKEAKKEYDIDLVAWKELTNLQAIVLAVAHEPYESLQIRDLEQRFVDQKVLIDVKGILDKPACIDAGFRFWRL